MKIYTKKGDKGQTSLFGGKRLPKHHIRIEAYGTVDELNAYLGLLRDNITDSSQATLLKEIQNRLFAMGSSLACDPDKALITPDVRIEDIDALETAMDEMDKSLPTLRNFILPGGHTVVSYCHIARCVCRRAERQVVALATHEPVEDLIVSYLNRLSDYLFVLGRKIAQDLNAEEVIWNQRG